MLPLMRLATLCAALALVLVSGCASTPLHVERYRGAYSTHFEGIPDHAEACAVVRNAGPTTIEWLELGLVATHTFEGVERKLRSRWVYRAPIPPGKVVALRFLYPPVADVLEVTLERAGSTGAGRALVKTAECSDEALRATLAAAGQGHTAPGFELRRAANATPDRDEALVAQP